jgi:hypothetical protein
VSATQRKHLWFTPDRTRFFLVPHDLTLPPGELAIRSLQALKSLVSDSSLRPYEVSAEEARAHVDAGWEGTLSQVRELWRDLTGAGEAEEPPRVDWLGVTPGEMVTDPEKARLGRKSLVERAAGLVGAELSEEQVSRYEASLERLGSAVLRDAERLRTGAGGLAEELETRLPEVEARLESALGTSGEALRAVGQNVLGRLAGLSKGEPPEPEERVHSSPHEPDGVEDAVETPGGPSRGRDQGSP